MADETRCPECGEPRLPQTCDYCGADMTRIEADVLLEMRDRADEAERQLRDGIAAIENEIACIEEELDDDCVMPTWLRLKATGMRAALKILDGASKRTN